MTASPSTPTMAFINNDNIAFSTSFSQNTLQRVRAGDEAEIAFSSCPTPSHKVSCKRVAACPIQKTAASQHQRRKAALANELPKDQSVAADFCI